MKRTKGIDVVIPVYNALDDLKLCVASIERYTDLSLDRVIFINDKSPDPNIMPYLKSIEKEGMVVLENQENLGFSGTINRGLVYSDRDVILLNTDTVVTAKWIDKIVACAYSDPAIGTVTPFSNNATLCSIPNFCQENVLPDGFTIDEYAALIDRCSLRKYPRITVAVGFCMFIKQELIELIGLFDQETFEKGYGEENDYCWRAEQMGYYHVLCDDTYIYHSGSASFVSEQKRKLMEDHAKILLDWYPTQMQRNDEYVRDNPDQYLRDNVEIYVKLNNGKKNVLYLLHADFREDAVDNMGGTQLHVKDLALTLCESYNIFVAARDGEYLHLTAYVGNERISFKFYIGPKPEFVQFYIASIDKVLRNIIKAFSIDMIHVQQVINLSFDVFHIAKEMGIPLMMTLHDFYYACPMITMLSPDGEACENVGEKCVECLVKQKGYAPRVSYIEQWHKICRTALGMCDVLFAPSQTVKDAYERFYPELAEKIVINAHGLDIPENKISGFMDEPSKRLKYKIERVFDYDSCITGWGMVDGVDSRFADIFLRFEDSKGQMTEYKAETVFRADLATTMSPSAEYAGFKVVVPDGLMESGTLNVQMIIKCMGRVYCSEIFKLQGYKKREKKRKRVAFIGGLAKHKGSEIAYHIIRNSQDQYEWYIFGGIGDEDLLNIQGENIHKIGWYMRDNIVSLLRHYQIDLVCIFSICAETFCYTLSESLIAGVPVIGTDIGAVGERISANKLGWLVPVSATADEIYDEINRILGDKDAYGAVKEKLERYHHKSVAEMCADYSKMYEQFDYNTQKSDDFDAQMIYDGYANVAYFGVQNERQARALLDQIKSLQVALLGYENSVVFRFARAIWGTNFPMKRTIKRVVLAMYKLLKKFRGC